MSSTAALFLKIRSSMSLEEEEEEKDLAFQERLCELELPIHLCQFFGKLTLMRKAKSGLSPKIEKCAEKEGIRSVMICHSLQTSKQFS